MSLEESEERRRVKFSIENDMQELNTLYADMHANPFAMFYERLKLERRVKTVRAQADVFLNDMESSGYNDAYLSIFKPIYDKAMEGIRNINATCGKEYSYILQANKDADIDVIAKINLHYEEYVKLNEEYDASVKNMEIAHSKSKWWNLWWYDRDVFKLDERCRRIKHELTILDLRHRSLCCFLSNSIQVEKIKEIAKTIQDAIETSRS